MFKTAVSKVTMENWESACDHVKSVEKFYWEKDGLVDEVVDRLCINTRRTEPVNLTGERFLTSNKSGTF